jgi:tRNA threonylcarbamoyladenosine biosynthesis protein TsaB
MRILALELSSARGSIAWLENGAELFVQEFANDRKHSGLFFEGLQRSIARFGKADRIVVGLGPGSYAGTRIAIATALGLQAATGAELIGLSSICAMPTDENQYAVVGDARRQSCYFARISERRCIEGPVLCAREELEKRIHSLVMPVFSTETLPTMDGVVINYPSARILAQIAMREAISETSTPLEPMYLREPHITEPRNLAR